VVMKFKGINGCRHICIYISVTRVMWLSSSEDRLIVTGVVLAWYQRVTDRLSDGQSDRIYHG